LNPVEAINRSLLTLALERKLLAWQQFAKQALIVLPMAASLSCQRICNALKGQIGHIRASNEREPVMSLKEPVVSFFAPGAAFMMAK
jgi:hypothetical protein